MILMKFILFLFLFSYLISLIETKRNTRKRIKSVEEYDNEIETRKTRKSKSKKHKAQEYEDLDDFDDVENDEYEDYTQIKKKKQEKKNQEEEMIGDKEIEKVLDDLINDKIPNIENNDDLISNEPASKDNFSNEINQNDNGFETFDENEYKKYVDQINQENNSVKIHPNKSNDDEMYKNQTLEDNLENREKSLSSDELIKMTPKNISNTIQDDKEENVNEVNQAVKINNENQDNIQNNIKNKEENTLISKDEVKNGLSFIEIDQFDNAANKIQLESYNENKEINLNSESLKKKYKIEDLNKESGKEEIEMHIKDEVISNIAKNLSVNEEDKTINQENKDEGTLGVQNSKNENPSKKKNPDNKYGEYKVYRKESDKHYQNQREINQENNPEKNHFDQDHQKDTKNLTTEPINYGQSDYKEIKSEKKNEDHYNNENSHLNQENEAKVEKKEKIDQPPKEEVEIQQEISDKKDEIKIEKTFVTDQEEKIENDEIKIEKKEEFEGKIQPNSCEKIIRNNIQFEELSKNKIHFTSYIIEPTNIKIQSNDKLFEKIKKISQISYQQSLHYLTMSHFYLSLYCAYPYNYFIYSIIGYFIACFLGVSNGENIIIFKKTDSVDHANLIERKFKNSIEILRKINTAGISKSDLNQNNEKIEQQEMDFTKIENYTNDIIKNYTNQIRLKINKLEKIKTKINESDRVINTLKNAQDENYNKLKSNLENLVEDQIELLKIISPDY